MFIANTAPKVRLIAVEPFGPKTTRFIGAMATQPRVNVNIVQVPPLHRLQYGPQYQIEHSEENARRVYDSHYACYAGELDRATRNGEMVMLVSGRYHEYTAPFYIAIKNGWGMLLKLVSFDQHFDCYQNQFNAAGFLRWMLDHRHLLVQELSVVGVWTKRPERIQAHSMLEPVIRNNYPGAVQQPELFAQALLDFSVGIVRQAYSLDRDIKLFGEPLEGVYQLINGFKLTLEDMWVEKRGVHLAESPQELPQGENLLVSFDGDVGNNESLIPSVQSLRPYFGRIRQNKIVGVHVCELDSPECNYNPEELAPLFTEILL